MEKRELEKLRQEVARLQARVDKLEAKLGLKPAEELKTRPSRLHPPNPRSLKPKRKAGRKKSGEPGSTA